MTHLSGYTNWYGANPAISTIQNCVKKKASQDGALDGVCCGKTLNYACSMAPGNSWYESTTSTPTIIPAPKTLNTTAMTVYITIIPTP